MAQYSSPSNLVSNVTFILDLPADHEDRADPQEETSLQLVNSELESQVKKDGSCEQVFGGSSPWLAEVSESVFTSSDPGLDKDSATKAKRRDPFPIWRFSQQSHSSLRPSKLHLTRGRGRRSS